MPEDPTGQRRIVGAECVHAHRGKPLHHRGLVHRPGNHAGAAGTRGAHEVFVHAGSSYYYTERKLFMTGTHPLLRVCPSIPLCYSSDNWDFGWLMARSDGHVARWLCDPYTLEFHKSEAHYAIRWFVAD